MTMEVLHVGAICSIPIVYEVVDIFPLVQPSMNVFVVEQHFLSDGFLPFFIAHKFFKVQVIV